MPISGTARTGFDVYANRVVQANKMKGLFQFSTVLPALALKNSVPQGAMNKFGVPDANFMIGKDVSVATLKSLSGGTHVDISYPLGELAGGKWYSPDGTGSSAGTDRSSKKEAMVGITWAQRGDPIAIENQKIKANVDQKGIDNIIEKAHSLTFGTHAKALSTNLYNGLPSDWTADMWDSFIGLEQWLGDGQEHDDLTKYIGSVDRSLVVNKYLRGAHSNTSYVISLDLIEKIKLTGKAGAFDDAAGTTATTHALTAYGSQADLVIVGLANYSKLKDEVLTRAPGSRQLPGDSHPKSGLLGILNEYVDWNGTMIVPDPFCGATDLFILDSSTWIFQIQGGANFKTTPFVDINNALPATGQPDITTAEMRTKGRLICTAPRMNAWFSNVV